MVELVCKFVLLKFSQACEALEQLSSVLSLSGRPQESGGLF